jgi:hypothetical protein
MVWVSSGQWDMIQASGKKIQAESQRNPGGAQRKVIKNVASNQGLLLKTAIFHPVDSSVCESHTTATSIQDQLLGVNIKTIEELHGAGVLQDLGNLYPRRDKLQHVAVILDRSGLVLGSVAHLQGILQHGDELLDLAVVQEMSGNAACRSQALQEVHPLGPLAV